MNILPLVFSLLLVFSFLCASFLKEVKSLTLIEVTLEGYHHTEKAIRNALTKRAFHKIKEESSAKPNTERPSSKRSAFHSRREQTPPLEASKFHLRALLKSHVELSSHPLYEPLAQLLRSLYQDRVFSHDPNSAGIEYKLIEAWVKKAEKFPAVKQLYYLCPDAPELQPIYYKMLKGTNRYTEEAGIAPLDHFLSLEQAEKAVYVHSASTPLLRALFGPKITDEILQKEREKWEETQKQSPLTKEDVEAVFLKHPSEASQFTLLQTHLSFSKAASKKKSLARRDQRTGIGIEKDLNL